MLKIATLVRSHVYDEHVQLSLKQVKDTSRVEPFLLLDTSHGEAADYPHTVSFSGSDMQAMGLPLYPHDRWAWFNGDYPLYHCSNDLSEYSHFCMIDYDVKVNCDLRKIFAKVEALKLDFLAAYAGFSNPNWMWYASASKWFDEVKGSLFPFVVVSRPLLQACLTHRLRQAEELRVSTPHSDLSKGLWLNAEALVPSIAHALGYNTAPLDAVVEGWTYEFFKDVDLLSWDQDEVQAVPMSHPVFPREKLLKEFERRLRSGMTLDKKKWLIARCERIKTQDPDLYLKLIEVTRHL